MSRNCIGCNHRRTQNEYFFSSIQVSLEYINYRRHLTNIRSGRDLRMLDVVQPGVNLCRNCYRSFSTFQPLPDDTPDPSILRKGIHAHGRTCVFGCLIPSETFICINKEIQFHLLVEYNFYSIINSRMCAEHLTCDSLWPFVKRIQREVANEELKIAYSLLREALLEQKSQPKPYFDMTNINSIEDDAFYNWIGYTKEEFLRIGRESGVEPRSLSIFLIKVRTNLSNKQIGALFRICKSSVANHLQAACSGMYQTLVARYINSSSRQCILDSNTTIAKELFDVDDDEAVMIFDGSYRYVGKSKNFDAQSQLYSGQKKRPLYKFMVGVGPNGFVHYVYGPFKASDNDAKILLYCHRSNALSTLTRGDLIVGDKGFRDSQRILMQSGFRMVMPEWSPGQLETSAANRTRLVTKVRYVIELTFGRLKQKFKIFQDVAHNSKLDSDFDYLRICFSLLNMFHSPIISDRQYPQTSQIMRNLVDMPNLLKNVVEAKNLTQVRIQYWSVTTDAGMRYMRERFPRLSEADLQLISLGSYQVALSRSYYALHTLSTFGIFGCMIHDSETYPINYEEFGIVVEEPMLIRVRMHAHHGNNAYRWTFVLIDTAKNDRDAVVEYFCTCPSGGRTTGCCSHVMTVIWTFGRAVYVRVKAPNEMLSYLCRQIDD